jgi:hypothetical protein
MATITPLPPHQSHLGTFPRLLFALNAVCAWVGLITGTTSSLLGLYKYPQTDPNVFGFNNGPIGRLVDTYSYFTIWSVAVVAIVMTVLAIAPNRGRIFKVLHLDALMMITVTGILYWMLLSAGSQSQGIDRIGNLFDHTLTPIVTVVVWLIVGPRNWIKWWMVFAALILPIVWAAYTIVRGTVLSSWPYPFLNANKYGLSAVLTTIVEIAIFGMLIGFIYFGIDRLLGRKARSSQKAADEAQRAA